jgi:hypothetical protein
MISGKLTMSFVALAKIDEIDYLEIPVLDALQEKVGQLLTVDM